MRQVGPWVLLGGILLASGAVGVLPVRLGDPLVHHASNLVALQRFLGLLFAVIVAIPSLAPSRFSFGAQRWGPPPWGPHLASHSLFLGQAAALALFFVICTLTQLGILVLSDQQAPPAPWIAALASSWLYGWGCLALARTLGAWLSLRQALGAYLLVTLLLPMVSQGGGEVTTRLIGLVPGPAWLAGAQMGSPVELHHALVDAAATGLFIVACNLWTAKGLAQTRLGRRGLDERNSKA